MGVPSFFRWLSKKYPKIISPVIDEPGPIVDGVQLPIDYAAPNPNGELDNLYLDMNGIVHPCSHPENKPAPETEDEMLLAVFEYTNHVLNMARPRKVLVMAVDGVAPRAKMNQQRSRRFRSVRDAQIENEAKQEELKKREMYGEIIADAVKNKKTWDSNAITPGTPFMDKLALALRYWTAFKLATDPGWKNLQVVISDATVPGEGEHKIMNFIRSQRSDPEYNPNTTHCIYGLDADLIFLGLATHEPHFKILREDVFAKDTMARRFNNTRISEEEKQRLMTESERTPFLWLHITALREYLAAELFVPRLPFPFDFERAIDDWVFMCFFCGNDFLPHLPCLDVRENSIDILLDIWKVVLPTTKTYMTRDGQLNLESVEFLMKSLGARESDIFKTKHIQHVRAEERYKQFKKRKAGNFSKGQDPHPLIPDEQLPMYDQNGNLAPGAWNLTTSDMVRLKKEIMLANEGNEEAIAIVRAQSEKNNNLMKEITKEEMDKVVETANKSNFSAAELLKKKLAQRKHKLEEEEEEEEKKKEEEEKTVKKMKTEEDDLNEKIIADVEAEEDSESISTNEPTPEIKPSSIIMSSEVTSGVIDTNDMVKLYEPGYWERYYTSKFHIATSEIEPIRKDMVKSYIEGVSWVLLYYYQGCPSWNWYYPYHYAPFAADFFGIADQKVEFDEGIPFLPYEQLMSVLPAASGHTLPPIFRPLMSSPDSPIIDFYPEDFAIDMNGKTRSWQGISLLPFIDEKRLLETVRAQYPKLTDAERSRNVRKEAILLISNKNLHYEKFAKKLYKEASEETELIFRHFKTGLSGIISKDVEGFTLNGKLACPVESESLPELSTNLFLKVLYKLTPMPSKNKSLLLNGYIPPKQVLDQYDIEKIRYKGGRESGRYNNNFQNNVVSIGPEGTTQYSPRVGGYKSFFYFAKNGTHMENSRYGNQPRVHDTRNNNGRTFNDDRYDNNRFNNQGRFNNGGQNRYNNGQNRYNNGSQNRYNNGGQNRYNNRYNGNSRYSGSNNR